VLVLFTLAFEHLHPAASPLTAPPLKSKLLPHNPSLQHLLDSAIIAHRDPARIDARTGQIHPSEPFPRSTKRIVLSPRADRPCHIVVLTYGSFLSLSLSPRIFLASAGCTALAWGQRPFVPQEDQLTGAAICCGPSFPRAIRVVATFRCGHGRLARDAPKGILIEINRLVSWGQRSLQISARRQ